MEAVWSVKYVPSLEGQYDVLKEAKSLKPFPWGRNRRQKEKVKNVETIICIPPFVLNLDGKGVI